MSKRLVSRVVAAAAVAAIAAPLALAATAQAAVDPVGRITYRLANGSTYIANADGSSAKVLSSSINGAVSWAPDGSKIAYRTSQGVYIAKPDGTGARRLTPRGGGAPVWSRGGTYLVFSDNTEVWYVYAYSDADAKDSHGNPAPFVVEGLYLDGMNPNPGPIADTNPSISVDGSLAFQRAGGTDPGIYTLGLVETAPVLRIPGGTSPAYAPDGSTIAYAVHGATPAESQIWLANADGTDAEAVTTEAAGADQPVWSADGISLLYRAGTSAYTLNKINLKTKAVTALAGGSGGRDASWQAIRNNDVDRIFGDNAIETGIAASQYTFEPHGDTSDPYRRQANAVVLSRADAFYDALAGSALAINKNGPLLTTPPATLDLKVQAEIQRVLGTSGTVYVLGSVDAISKATSDKLTSLGYTVKRLAGGAGGNMFDTNVAINNEMLLGSTPSAVIVATGKDFYDALSAGPATAAEPGTVIVLTWGDTMFPASAAYLNKIDWNTVPIVTAGGWGEDALLSAYDANMLPNWGDEGFGYYRLTGTDAIDTSLKLAKFFWGSPRTAAVATNASWYDALPGGAMIGMNGGPLVLNPKATLDPRVAAYLSDNSNSMNTVALMGSNATLADSLIAPVGNAIGVSGAYTYNQFKAVVGPTAMAKAQVAPSFGANHAPAPERFKAPAFGPSVHRPGALVKTN